MVILAYIPSLDRSSGGPAAYVQFLSKELGKNVVFHIACHRSPNPLCIENAAVHYIGGLIGSLRRDWLRLLDAVRPDIVHVNCCWMPQCALVQRLSQCMGYKVILTPHGMLEPWIIRRHYLTRKLPALLLYQKRAVVDAIYLHATAESEKNNLLGLGYNHNVAVIANGIDVYSVELKTTWKRKKRILFLSRVCVNKGIECLIEAVALLKDCLHDYIVTVAGEGDKRYIETLKRKADNLDIGCMFSFVGGVYDSGKWDLIKESDILVLPTLNENFGIVIAEALACGTPVITTKGAPWKDLETWNCGWWIERDVDSLVGALKEFLKLDEFELERMGRNGRQLVEEKYSSKVMADNMVRLYESLM